MESVSAKWRAAMDSQIRPQAMAQVDITFVQAGSMASGLWQYKVDSGTIAAPIAQGGFWREYTGEKTYATCETGRMILNGSQLIAPTQAEYNDDWLMDYYEGFVSDEISDGNGNFLSSKVLWYEIVGDNDTAYMGDIPAMTFTFDNDMPTALVIQAYYGFTLKSTINVTVTERQQIVKTAFSSINKIKITINKMSVGLRRLRIKNIELSCTLHFDDNNINTIEIVDDVDPISRRLPTQTFKMAISDYAGEYDPDNPNGWIRVFESSTKTHPRVNLKWGLHYEDGTEEWINGGTYYMLSLPNSDNGTVTFDAVRLLSTFTDTNSIGQAGGGNFTLDDAANSILFSVDVDVERKFSSYLQGLLSNAYATDKVRNELFQLIANAAMMALYTGRNDNICILDVGSTYYQNLHINSDAITGAYPKVSMLDKLSAVESKYYTYDASGKSSSITIGTSIVTNIGEGVLDQIDNPLITNTAISNQYINRYISHISQRRTYSFDCRGYPEVDAGDLIKLSTKYDTGAALVLKNVLQYNGAWSGSMIVKMGGYG